LTDLQKQFGNIDIYLFDQILRGRVLPGMRILDAGCGEGRNLVYFLQEGFEVFGIDQDPQCISEVMHLASHLASGLPPTNFQVGRVEAIPHSDAYFEVIISNAVLHFAEDERQFLAMVAGMWRVLKSGGVLFTRLASSIGMEKQVKRVKGRRFLLPDGTERFLVDAAMLENLTRELGAELIDPIKSTIVQNQRCMTTWVIRKF
jgi:2-polyprenyl-3-methyl-5-hydroxy-6-metoxy-1,4-benzoquinol methylase